MVRVLRVSPSNRLSGAVGGAAVPATICVAALSPACTALIAALLVLLYLRHCRLAAEQRDRMRDKSLFFVAWMLSSIFCLMFVFHIFVINMLEILFEENLLLLVLTTSTFVCLYYAKLKANETAQSLGSLDDVEALLAGKPGIFTNDTSTYCCLCQAYTPSHGSHCFWLDCCISNGNKRLFYSGIFLGICALLYGSDLTLTTICHPYIFYWNILLPDDCSDVYTQYNLAVCFVCALYSLLMASLLVIFFLRKSIKCFQLSVK